MTLDLRKRAANGQFLNEERSDAAWQRQVEQAILAARPWTHMGPPLPPFPPDPPPEPPWLVEERMAAAVAKRRQETVNDWVQRAAQSHDRQMANPSLRPTRDGWRERFTDQPGFRAATERMWRPTGGGAYQLAFVAGQLVPEEEWDDLLPSSARGFTDPPAPPKPLGAESRVVGGIR